MALALARQRQKGRTVKDNLTSTRGGSASRPGPVGVNSGRNVAARRAGPDSWPSRAALRRVAPSRPMRATDQIRPPRNGYATPSDLSFGLLSLLRVL